MAATFNEALLERMIAHQVGILRFSGSVRNEIWALLDATERDIRREIVERAGRIGLEGTARLRALERLLATLRGLRARSWDRAAETWNREMRALALAEPGFLGSILEASVPVVLAPNLPSPAKLRAIVATHPFPGPGHGVRPLAAWARRVKAEDIARIEASIKAGLVQGESGRELARRVVGTVRMRGRDGLTQIARRDAATITRTVASGVAAEARRAFALENKELMPTWLFVATLDSRTTPVCRANDGKVFPVGEGPRLPLHPRERSTEAPILDGEIVATRPVRAFTKRQLLREFADERGIARVTSRALLPHGTKGKFDAFARGRMRDLTGMAPGKMTYGGFLRSLSAAQQDDIMGPTRGALFRRGGLDLDKFVEFDGSELTLAQLAERHTEAFLQANLDPAAFAA